MQSTMAGHLKWIMEKPSTRVSFTKNGKFDLNAFTADRGIGRNEKKN